MTVWEKKTNSMLCWIWPEVGNLQEVKNQDLMFHCLSRKLPHVSDLYVITSNFSFLTLLQLVLSLESISEGIQQNVKPTWRRMRTHSSPQQMHWVPGLHTTFTTQTNVKTNEYLEEIVQTISIIKKKESMEGKEFNIYYTPTICCGLYRYIVHLLSLNLLNNCKVDISIPTDERIKSQSC